MYVCMYVCMYVRMYIAVPAHTLYDVCTPTATYKVGYIPSVVQDVCYGYKSST